LSGHPGRLRFKVSLRLPSKPLQASVGFSIAWTHNLFFGDMHGKLGSPVNMILLKWETNWEHG
jgi:hypothetical protein